MGMPSSRLGSLGLGIAAALVSTGAAAQTNVAGGNITNETWTQAGSPYIVMGDVFVPAGSYLRIQAGVDVQIADTDGQTSTPDTTRVAISISGALRIDGTKDEPVHIHAQSGESIDTWHGLVIHDSATEAKISHTILEHARYGLDVDNALVEIYACEFAKNHFHGVNLDDGAAIFDRVMLRENENYGVSVAGGTVTMSNVVAYQNGNFGFFLPAGTVTIFNATAYDNDLYGLSCTGANVNLYNSIVADNGAYGLYREAGSVQLTTNNFFGNLSGAIDGSVTSVDTFTSDPELVDPNNGDLTLQSSSPCVDRGIPNGAPDNDFVNAMRPVDGDTSGGAQHDVGAYEYMPMAICGDAVVNNAETCDDGASNGSYGFCNGTCDGVGPFCGDGTTNAPFESCDDGNTTDGDGCDAYCQDENMGMGGAGGAGGSSNTGGNGTGGSGTGGSPVCASGEQVACACPNGAQGVQTCNDDGSSYGSCVCPDVDGATDTESGGCDCAVIGGRERSGNAALLLLLGAAWLGRKRRRGTRAQ